MFSTRRMELEDIEEVVGIEKECFSVPWSSESFLLELKSKIAYYLVAVNDEGLVVGYGGMWLIVGEGNITNIGVRSDYRRMGIASLIVEGLISFGVISNLFVINLEVRSSNIAAISLYKNYGFIEVGNRKDYYRKPNEDALLLSLALNEED